MNITVPQLAAQYRRAATEWPWVSYVERIRALPTMLLWAIASRETNMRNIVGDSGNGVGIWQRDNRAWSISTAWYLAHPRQQAEDAATLLLANMHILGDWADATAAYNAGLPTVRDTLRRGGNADSVTTGHDYSTDVMARRAALLALTR